MSKRALLIGINYFNTPSAQLYGCIFDIIQIKNLLIDIYGFAEKDIIMLRDDDSSNMPTKQRILNECAALVATRSAYAFLHYSGHGTSIKDSNGDEKDGQDECIVPCDFQTAGIITDDDLNRILKNIQSNGIALFDSCRSGTIMDLQYESVNNTITTPTTNGLFCFSGCQDSQTSAETFAVSSGLPQGAATAAFITVLRRLKYYPTIVQLHNELKNELKANGFEQVPNLTSNIQPTSGSQFPFPRDEGISQVSSLHAQIAELTAKNTALRAQINLNSSSLISLQNQLTASKNRESTIQSQLIASKTQIATLQSQLNTYLVRVVSVNGENSSLKQQISRLQQQIVSLTTKKK